ncbi:hypothetical protein ABIE85_006168 [Bradyrhizobium diazoefficiens]
MAGRVTWSAPQQPDEIRDAAAKPLPQRLKDSIGALVGAPGSDDNQSPSSLYGMLRANAVKAANLDASDADDKLLIDLLAALVDNARRDAISRASVLIPAAASGKDVGRRLTVGAPPVTFRIDQLRSFAGSEDLWTRLAGLGVLISRTASFDDAPADWWTLNVATLHIPESTSGTRAPLGPDNAVAVDQSGWPSGSIVDPVAMQVGETDGVRSALVSYDNRSLVGEMQSDAELDQPVGATTMFRRIEAYAFPPPAASYRLPALSFGYAYHVLPYVIGQGGALPPILRRSEDHPLQRKDAITASDGSKRIRLDNDPKDFRRTALYRRTRTIGAPRLANGKLPGIPDGVPPLALELPIRPPPVTIGPNVDGRFFIDKDGTSGVLDFRPPSGADTPGLRFEIGGIRWGTAGAGKLSLRFRGRSAAGDVMPPVTADLPDISQGRFRIDLFSDDAGCAKSDESQGYAEDAFNFSAPTALDAKLKDVTAWRSVSVEIIADKEVEFEPPTVTPIARVKQNDGSSKLEIVAKTRLAPECGHQSRTVTVMDGIKAGPVTGRTSLSIEVSRPSLEFGTYERWINAPLFETTLASAKSIAKSSIDAAHATTTRVAAPNVDVSLDDPAVTALFAELVCIFPQRITTFPMARLGEAWTALDDVLGFSLTGQRKPTKRAIAVQLVNDKAQVGISGSIVSVLAGSIYELRIYPGVPDSQPSLSLFGRDARLSPAVRGTMRKCPIDPSMRLGSPLVVTIEVATDTTPKHLVVTKREQRLVVSQIRPPQVPEDRISVSLADDFVRDGKSYPSMRYCHLAALISQRWSWRGRPLDDLWPSYNAKISDDAFDTFFDVAFSDRRDDDVGDILERRIERSHAYGGRERRDGPVDRTPTLFDRSLEWKGGVNLWRHGVRMTSRYAAMRPGSANLVVYSHLGGNGPATWQNDIVLDRPAQRQPKRPGLALVLPLTEPMMAHGTVPPLLALFNERLFAGLHVGDGVEVAIDTSRHPLPLIERLGVEIATVAKAITDFPPPAPDDEEKQAELQRLQQRHNALEAQLSMIKRHTPPALKFWQERGPDPIRTGAGADGSILPLRLDGPIGYTFDLGTEAARFDHAGYLISPIHQDLAPWSLVKLRFRRHESPEGLDPATNLTKDGPAASGRDLPAKYQTLKPAKYRLANSRALMANPPRRKEIVFPTEHEGLVIDLPESAPLTTESKSNIRVSFVGDIKPVPPKVPPEPIPDQHWVQINFARDLDKGQLTLSFETDLGDAGTWSTPVQDGTVPAIRLVLSARDKPQTGEPYEPAGDIAVRVRLNRSEAIDAIEKAEENRWLAVACIPLLSSRVIAIDEPVVVEVAPKLSEQAGAIIAPIRLSTFTPALWCQFTEAMSLFDATFTDRAKATVSVDELGIKVSKTTTTIVARNGTLQSLAAIAAGNGQNDGSQVEELVVLVMTRYIRDVFDRIRERPVAAKLLDPNTLAIDLSNPDWPPLPRKDGKDIPLTAADMGTEGRVRFLKILRGKTRLRGGFLDDDAVFPKDFFSLDMLDSAEPMNPPDSKAMILGTSLPIEWKRES